MTTRHLVDKELLPFLDVRPPLHLTVETLPAVRKEFREMRQQLMAAMPPVPGVLREERRVPGPSGSPDVRVLVYRPENASAPCPAYLHIHGGGYVVGEPEMTEPRNMLYARELGAVIVSVDYRLAPEAVFPGAVEDCYAALKWIHANARMLNVDVSRIAVGGESAGGGLAACLALLARDRAEVPVIHQQLIYPMLDDRPAADRHAYTGEFVWNHAANHFGWSSILGREPGGPDTSLYASAARAETLAGLPATFITSGALDLFLEEDMDYARRLTRAGVPVEMHIYPGAVHGFDMAPESRLAKTHARDQLDALKRALVR